MSHGPSKPLEADYSIGKKKVRRYHSRRQKPEFFMGRGTHNKNIAAITDRGEEEGVGATCFIVPRMSREMQLFHRGISYQCATVIYYADSCSQSWYNARLGLLAAAEVFANNNPTAFPPVSIRLDGKKTSLWCT